MVRKPEIQYVGQFYVYGSEARELETVPKKKKPKTILPKPKRLKAEVIYVDPVAVLGIVVSVVMLVVMLAGIAQMNESWQEYEAMSNHMAGLRTENASLTYQYRSGFDPESVKTTALAIGMVPQSELQVVQVELISPEPEPEPTAWDDFLWFITGLFA